MCVCAFTCVFVCEHVDLVEDIVNWLRLTFSRGIVKGTVVAHFQSVILETPLYICILH